MGPPQHLSKDMAPYRKTLMILRPSGEIKYEREWEKWDTLSNRQLIRPAHPCRLNVTVFARDSQPSETEAAQPSQVHPSSSEFGQANGFGLQFIQSPCHENQLLLMHKNLGHPSNEQLSKALQANGQRPEMVRAALELKCPVCAASSAPKHQRPSTLKPLLDFNYRIYLDGIQWTNKEGQSFQLYHIVDAGTHSHVACIALSHTSKYVISLLNQFWFNWAGVPQELKIDSGTELNSEEFMHQMQQLSIRCTTTCPEAHWQNGTIERHGGFLQHMLTKIDVEVPIKT